VEIFFSSWPLVLVPVLAHGSLERMVGHHLIWILMWILVWRAVHRLGWLLVSVVILVVLGIGALAMRRKASSPVWRRLR